MSQQPYHIVGYTENGQPVYGSGPTGTNGLAIASFVVSLSMLLGFLAIPFGHVARRQIRQSGEQGAGLALAGLIIGYLSLGVFAVFGIGLLVVANYFNNTTPSYSAPSFPVAGSTSEPPPVLNLRPQTTATATQPPTTRSAPTTTQATTTAAPTTVGNVSNADRQGFLDTSARCNSTNPAVTLARTTKSEIVVCLTGAGRYYYKGVRLSDGARIEIDDPQRTADGFVATNGATRYAVSSTALTITQGTAASYTEAVLEYWSS